MDLKQLIKFGLENSSDPVIKNPVLRAALQGPRNMADGGRIGLSDGQLVTPSVDGSRPGYKGYQGGQYKAGKKITFTSKEAKVINADLPNGINLVKNQFGNWQYHLKKKAGPPNIVNITRAVTKKDFLKDEGLNFLKEELDTFMKKHLPNRITKEKFEQLRYLDENIILTQSEFANKLNDIGYTTTLQGKSFNQHTVSILDIEIGNKKHKKYTFKEQKDFLKNSLDSNEYKAINDLDISKENKESLIRKKANNIRWLDKRSNELGFFAGGSKREDKLFRNYYEAHTKGTRIEIGGKFNGKDLSKRKNWPRDANGNVDWSIKGPDKKPAWKSVVFTDTQTPKGKVKFTYNNLKTQVDDTFV